MLGKTKHLKNKSCQDRTSRVHQASKKQTVGRKRGQSQAAAAVVSATGYTAAFGPQITFASGPRQVCSWCYPAVVKLDGIHLFDA